MGAVIVSLLPLIVGAALGPGWIIFALFLLRGEGGVVKALAFAAGAMTVRLVQGVLFGYVFGTAADAYGERGSNLITSTLRIPTRRRPSGWRSSAGCRRSRLSAWARC